MTLPKPPVLGVALLGFGDFERSALMSYLRLSSSRVPAYAYVDSVDAARFVIADADHIGTVDTVVAAGRVADTVFIGSSSPDGALAWMMRPIDPLQVFRELDATTVLRTGPPAAAPPAPIQATPAAAPAGAAPDTRRGAHRAGDASAPATTLLVDDSEVGLRFLERQLQALGLRTDTATHSQRALQLMAQRHYDLIFLEVDLGPQSDQDGLTLCQQIKRKHTAPLAGATPPKVVMVSANAAATDRVRGSFAGCDGYLAKPIDEDALRRALRQVGVQLPVSDDAPYVNSRPGLSPSLQMPLDAVDAAIDGPTPRR